MKYIEEIEKSALAFIKQDIKIKQHKFGPADMTDEFAKARRLEEIINEFNEKAREQAKRGEYGKELSFNLSLPRQKEVKPEKEKIVKVEAQLRVLRAWSKSKEIDKDRAMKQFIENQIPLFRGLIKLLSHEAKKREV
ncbi:MAG: hypothetical protein QME61_02710 [Patescibacteria group bacterium]|nr:hypothetical protein [Patescibacteria group bacterium]